MKYLDKPSESLNFTAENIANIEKVKDCIFVGDFHCENLDTMIYSPPVSVFYQKNPPSEYSNYFGLYYRYDFKTKKSVLYITSGDFIFKKPIIGAIADDGEIIYSRHLHDYRESKDGSTTVDGGVSYLHGRFKKTVLLVPDKDRLRIEEND